mgnify:CR=1 FL=1
MLLDKKLYPNQYNQVMKKYIMIHWLFIKENRAICRSNSVTVIQVNITWTLRKKIFRLEMKKLCKEKLSMDKCLG